MKGFTLLELLIVIGIVVILIGVTIAAINPSRQVAQANRATRWANVTTIANAVAQSLVDSAGVWTCTSSCPVTVSTTNISSATGTCDLCTCLVPTYLGSLPIDPTIGTSVTNCSSYTTGYSIFWSTTTPPYRVTIISDLDSSISVTR